MISHAELCREPALLLRNKPLGETPASKLEKDLDWAFAAAVLDDGVSCITTTSDELLAPQLGGNRAVRERDDYYFGQDDYLVWPQSYNPSRPHLPFITRRTTALEQKKFTFMWNLPQRATFVLVDNNSFTGLGKLFQLDLDNFIGFHQQLLNSYGTNLTQFTVDDRQAVGRLSVL